MTKKADRTESEREALREARRAWTRAKLRWLLAGLVDVFGPLALDELRKAIADLADNGKLDGSTKASPEVSDAP